MFGMGMGELMVVLIVALLVLGPDKIPEAAKTIGKVIRNLRDQTKGVQEQLAKDKELSSTVAELKSALTGEDPPRTIAPPRKPRVMPPHAQPPALPVAEASPSPGPSPSPSPAAAEAPSEPADPVAPLRPASRS